MKMGLNPITNMNGGNYINAPFHTQIHSHNLVDLKGVEKQNQLIEVSDDEDSEDEECEDESQKLDVDDSGEETDSESSDSDDDNSMSEETVKVIKINVTKNDLDDQNNTYSEDIDLIGDLDNIDVTNLEDDIPEISQEYTEEILSLKYDELKDNNSLVENESLSLLNNPNDITSELKTISINLGDECHQEQIDFKKLQLPKLRSIVVEKGLTTTSEAHKLKKPELLKLLGSE